MKEKLLYTTQRILSVKIDIKYKVQNFKELKRIILTYNKYVVDPNYVNKNVLFIKSSFSKTYKKSNESLVLTTLILK